MLTGRYRVKLKFLNGSIYSLPYADMTTILGFFNLTVIVSLEFYMQKFIEGQTNLTEIYKGQTNNYIKSDFLRF